MIKVLFYIPMHVFNFLYAWLTPRWLSIIMYNPSSELVRDQELHARNKMRLMIYYQKTLDK